MLQAVQELGRNGTAAEAFERLGKAEMKASSDLLARELTVLLTMFVHGDSS